MVKIESSDVIDINDFEFAWRVTDVKRTALPEGTLRQIRPLSAAKSEKVVSDSALNTQAPYAFDPGAYHAVRHRSLECENDNDRAEIIRWLRELPINETEDVFVCWHIGKGVAAVMEWQVFLNIWDDLWYPFDRLCVYDDSREWAVMFGPEEFAVYIERGAVDGNLPITDPAYGLQLFQPT